MTFYNEYIEREREREVIPTSTNSDFLNRGRELEWTCVSESIEGWNEREHRRGGAHNR